MTPYLLTALAAFIVGRLTKRSQKPVRISSNAYFHRRPDLYPQMAHWSVDVADRVRAQRGR